MYVVIQFIATTLLQIYAIMVAQALHHDAVKNEDKDPKVNDDDLRKR
jgi:hypothetical protein